MDSEEGPFIGDLYFLPFDLKTSKILFPWRLKSLRSGINLFEGCRMNRYAHETGQQVRKIVTYSE